MAKELISILSKLFVRGNEYFGDARTIDTHVKTLRQKLEKVGPHVIITVWGVGYKYDELNFDI